MEHRLVVESSQSPYIPQLILGELYGRVDVATGDIALGS
jgi:hypothetical protein